MMVLGACVVPIMDPPHLFDVHWTMGKLVRVGTSAAVAVCINISTTLVLGAAGALALVLLGQLKTCSVVLFGALFFDGASAQSFVGCLVAVSGLGVYTSLKMRPVHVEAELLEARRPITEPSPESEQEDEMPA